MDWKELAVTSHYQTAVAVRQALLEGNMEDAQTGIKELTEALGRSEKRVLRSQMIRLMMHIIKWRTEPQRRSRSWLATIENARVEIDAILEDEPSLKRRIPELWEKSFRSALRLAEKETGIRSYIKGLSEEEVFEEEYSLSDL
ncbi:DUF29 domain-containing protein [Desulfonema magnum]|uniref:DUF29 n=1 Tax=Desulfonema magnum TaxID=45655 RepID=A0A975GLS5_9BACT|nr:DUF29 domain-containing protein [Desulfonema magnum]QTA86156.1 DUF29 [Desulfonema magnum]